MAKEEKILAIDNVYLGNSEELLRYVRPDSIACSLWSPPYFVGKSYEQHLHFQGWCDLIRSVIELHTPILVPGGFLVINIGDILCFEDKNMPRIQAANPTKHKVHITREQVLQAKAQHPEYNRYQLADLFGCSEQTIDRRLKNNNIRGGKYKTQTRVKIVGGLLEEWAYTSKLYLYERKIWVKDPAWVNCRWHSLSYRSVDEFEYLYIFWKPGITKVDRTRLSKHEWSKWGSRSVWYFPSVRANDNHEAKFPIELPSRIIRLLTEPDDVVMDCFLGSGTTAIAAIREGRHFIGIEKEERYFKECVKAISTEQKKLRLGLSLV